MVEYFYIIVPGLLAFILTVLLVPMSMKTSRLIGAIDHPGKLTVHSRPIPRLGGAAIFVSAVLVSLTFLNWFVGQLGALPVALIATGLVGIFFLGVADDVLNLRPRRKLVCQVICSLLAVSGLAVLFPSRHVGLFIFIFVFIVGFTNTLNLLDGLDGLASGVAAFIAVGFGVVSWLSGQQIPLLGSALVLGASLGFLIFNRNPACVFLGDCGSLLLGFSLALLLSYITLGSESLGVLLPLIIIAGIPTFDTSSVVIRRVWNGRSVFEGDRNHLYDLIIRKGYSARRTVAFFYAAALLLTWIGLLLYHVIS